EIEMQTVEAVETDGDIKKVITDGGEFTAKAVIIAVGVRHRQTGLPNENSLVGKGISYCATCDGAFYRNRTVAGLGGGNSALQDAVLLSGLCKKVYVIQNLDFLTGETKLINKVNEKENIEIITGTILDGITGSDALEYITLKKVESDEVSNLSVDGLFVAIGLVPDNERFSGVAKLNDGGYFDSNESCLTATPGIYAAGDCRDKKVRQIATAVSDGAVAALAACSYIDNSL
ncbi:MAG: FAD-dependent oxidoreductase, partial [Clostridia bacterium]|nr:FAD-dependent oxidoreductase [Clostridia bacterium]